MKKFLIILAIPIAILFVSVAALTFWINPNQFKPLLIEKAKQHTGLDVVIQGDINWQFFPKPGIEIGETQIVNPQGFEQKNLLSIDKVGLSLDLLPLFSKHLSISNVELDGAAIFWQLKADQSSNIDPLLERLSLKEKSDDKHQVNQKATNPSAQVSSTQNQSPSNSPETKEAIPTDMQAWQVSVSGLDIKNASLTAIDEPMSLRLGFEDLNFQLEDYAPNHWSDMQLSAKGYYNQQAFDIGLTNQIWIDPENKSYAIESAKLTGSFSDKAQSLFVDRFDMDIGSLQVSPTQYQMKKIAVTTDLRSPEANLNGLSFSFDTANVDEKLNAEISNLQMTGDIQAKIGEIKQLNAQLSLVQFSNEQLQLGQSTLKAAIQTDQLSLPELTLDLDSAHLSSQQMSAKNIALTGNLEQQGKASALDIELAKFESDFNRYQLDDLVAKANLDALGAKLTNAQFNSKQLIADFNAENQLSSLNINQLAFDGGIGYLVKPSSNYQAQHVNLNLGQLNSTITTGDNPHLKTLILNQLKLKGERINSPQYQGNIQLDIDKLTPNQQGKTYLSIQGKLADNTQVNLTQSSQLSLNQQLNQISFQNLNLSGELAGKTIALSPLKLKAKANGEYLISKQQLNLKKIDVQANQVHTTGNFAFNSGQDIPQIRFDLSSNSLNLDELLSQLNHQSNTKAKTKSSTKRQSSQAKGKSSNSNQEPDLTALKTLDIQGKVKVQKLIYEATHFSNFSSQFVVNRGVVDIHQLSAGVYSGVVNLSGRLDARNVTPKYNIKSNIKNINIQSLLKSVANYDKLTGRGNVTLNANGSSLIPSRLKANLAGNTTLSLTNGELYGINIPYQIRKNYALIKGNDIPKESQTTKFSSLQGRFDFGSGNAKTKNLKLNAQGLKVSAQGQANYVKETMDFKVQADVSKISDHKGRLIKDLQGVSVPIRVKGPWSALEYQLDLKGLLHTEAIQKVSKKAKTKIDKEIERFTDGDNEKADALKQAADSLLNGLFK